VLICSCDLLLVTAVTLQVSGPEIGKKRSDSRAEV
jgi:hypothetical protein